MQNGHGLYKSILIIKRGALGDLLAATAGIVQLRKKYPSAHLCLLSDSLAKQICPVGTIVDEIIDEKDFLKNKFDYLKLLWLIRKRKFDLIINMRWASEVSGLLALFGGSKVTAGAGPWFPRKMFTFFPPAWAAEEENGHEYLLNLRIVQALGLPEQVPTLYIYISEGDRKWADSFFSEAQLNPSQILLMTPMASTPLKAWPPERFIEIGKKFISHFEGKVLITFAPSDEAEARNVKNAIGNGAILAPSTTVNQLAALVSKVKLCLCNNSGIMHVAYAVGTPVVCINTSIGWTPFGDWNLAVTQLPDQKDHSDNRRLTNQQTYNLLTQISVERVWEALSKKWISLAKQDN